MLQGRGPFMSRCYATQKRSQKYKSSTKIFDFFTIDRVKRAASNSAGTRSVAFIVFEKIEKYFVKMSQRYVWTSPKVLWSGEKKFNLDGPDGFSYYWHDLRKEQEIFSTRAQDGGSVMIWASFGWGGKSSICFVDGRMNAMGYREVLRHHLVAHW